MKVIILARGRWFWKRYAVQYGNTTKTWRFAQTFATVDKAARNLALRREWLGETCWRMEQVSAP